MALFGMMKNFLSPITLEIECSDSFYARQGAITGQVKVTSQETWQIDEVVIIMVELCRDGGHEDKYVRGKASVCSRPFTITAGEEIRLDFSLNFTLPERGWDRVINEGGVLGTLGKIAQFYDKGSERINSSYELTAAAEVRGTKFDPKVTKWISRSE